MTKKNVEKQKDIDYVSEQVEQVTPEAIVNKHMDTRHDENNTSGLRLENLLPIKIYVTCYEY